MARKQIGGSFAPPLSDEQITSYEQLAKACDDRKCSGFMLDLVKMVRAFRETGDSKQPGKPHPAGRGVIVPLEDAEIERMWDLVPWPEECDLMGQAFDTLTGETRNAAYHLLWFARELTLDREPITSDKI